MVIDYLFKGERLKLISFSSNNLTGLADTSLQNFSSLARLRLDSNQLSRGTRANYFEHAIVWTVLSALQ